MAPSDPAQISSNPGVLPNSSRMDPARRGPPIGPNTTIKLDEPVFDLVKRFSNLPEHLHHAQAITVEAVRNSWFPMMTQLRNEHPEAFNENTLHIVGHQGPIFDTIRNIWPERTQFDIGERAIIIEFIIRSATEIGGRRTVRRNPAISANRPANPNGERQPRPLDFTALDNQENACRHFLFQKFSHHLHTLNELYKNSSRGPVLPPIPTEMPESESKRVLRANSTEEPSIKKVKTEEGEEEELREDETCQICLSARKTHAFIHAVQPSTSHFICCERCANQCNYAISGCPLCRLPVIAVTKVI